MNGSLLLTLLLLCDVHVPFQHITPTTPQSDECCGMAATPQAKAVSNSYTGLATSPLFEAYKTTSLPYSRFLANQSELANQKLYVPLPCHDVKVIPISVGRE